MRKEAASGGRPLILVLGVMQISIQDLGSIGELLGAVATVGTLAYLAIQIRANTKSVEAASRHSVTKEFRAFNQNLLVYFKAWDEGLLKYPNMDYELQQQFAALFHDLLLFFQSVQALFDSGSLERETFNGYTNFVAMAIRTPGGSAMWEDWKGTYTPKMVATLNEAMGNDSLPDLLDQVQYSRNRNDA